MKKNFVRAALTASLLCTTAGVAAVVLSTSASAQMEDYGGGSSGDATNKPAPAATQGKPSDTAVTNPAIGKALQEAQKDLQANDFTGAAAAIQTAQGVADPTPIETYYINKFAAALAIDTKNYAAATKAYEANAASPVMPDTDKKEVFHNLMLLTSANKDWQGVVNYGKQLEAVNGMDDQTYGVIALAYYNLKDMTSAKTYAQKSIDAAKAAGKQPQQASLEIVMGAQANGHDQTGAVATLEQIILQYNKPDDWRQLTNVGLGTKGIKNIDALFIYRLKDMTGSLTESDDYVTPGEIDAQLTFGYSVEAVKFYEAGINAGKVKPGDVPGLAKARKDAAQDRASLATYAASAAKSAKGDQDLKMAEDYWGYGRYADAEASARSAIAKGGLKDPGEGLMVLGTSLVAQGKNDEAIQTFSQVTGNEGRMKAAHLWSLYAQAKKNQAGGTTAAAPAQPPAH
jgi:tetratricopeptide (TPR) repeat protein